jgi:hypothetical protein
MFIAKSPETPHIDERTGGLARRPARWFALNMEKYMKRLLAPLVLGGALLATMPTEAAEIDWKKVDTAIGKAATISGEIHRYGLPRSDLKVTLEGVEIKPTLALGGWVAFAELCGNLGDAARFRRRGLPALRGPRCRL